MADPRRPLLLTSHFPGLALAALVLAAATGCGGGAGDGVSVDGTVSYQEKPIDSATIAFYPTTGRPVTAAVVDGAYSCNLPPGNYAVTVTVGATLPPGWKEGDPVNPPSIKLPQEFSSRVNTPLTTTVGQEGSQTIDFKLP